MTKPKSTESDQLLALERRRMAQLISALTVVAASGFITYWLPNHGIWPQWTYLLHTGAGIYLTLILLPYVRVHFQRTLGIRRPAMVILGLVSVALALGVAVSGLHLTVVGQKEALRWIYEAHVITAYAVLIGLLAHVFGQRLFSPGRRRFAELGWFPSVTSRALLKQAPLALLVCAIAIGTLTLAYQLLPTNYSTKPVIEPYELNYGEHPFRPSQTETTTGRFVDLRQISGSQLCATCHEDIARQWKASIHSQAASDEAYQSNINLLSKRKGMSATRYCEGCHAPVALLTGELTTGGKLDTHGHMHEGVNCKTCHGMAQIVHLKGVASYQFAPANDYLFGHSAGYVATKLHNFLIRIQPRQHRQDMARTPLNTPHMCATCHAQFMDKDMNNWGWVKMQDDFTAWLNSPYSGQGAQTFGHRTITRCQDCHMPLTLGDDPSADRNGMIRAHYMPGANTAIPWHTGDREQVQRVSDFLQADRIRISIEQPTRTDTVESNAPIFPATAIKTEAPAYFYLGEDVKLTMIVTNVGVGHDFPGGTTDINEAWIHVRVVDAQKNLVFESGGLMPDNDVDPKAHFYRTLAVDRNGKHVWRHDLFNMVGDSYKKVVPAGASDIVNYNFKIPAWAKSPLTVGATVRYRKLNNQYGRWALKKPNAELPIVDMARASLLLPVREKPKVAPIHTSQEAIRSQSWQ